VACAGSTGSIVVTKVHQYGDPRPGAYFIVQRDGGTVAVGTSDADGNVRFDGLIVEENYTVTELYPPYGCTGSADQMVFLGVDTPSQTLEFVNECETPRPSGSITVMKTDQAGTALPGVTFEIFATIMTPVAGTTDAMGRVPFNALVTDNIHYTVREVAAPEGCTAAADQTVILTETDPEQSVDVVNICDETDLPSPTPTVPTSTPVVTPTDPPSTPASIPSDPATIPVSTPSGSTSTSAASARGASVPTAPSPDPAGIGTQATTDPAPEIAVSSTLGVRALPSAGSGAAGGSLEASLVLMTLSVVCAVTGMAVSHMRHR
jgi:hypothetical protein